MTPTLSTRIVIAKKYGRDARPKVKAKAQLLAHQIQASAPDSPAARKIVEESFARLQALAGE